MAYFKLVNFNGIAPQVSPRLLGEGLGQTANNTDLDRGVLTPITSNSTVATLNAPTGSVGGTTSDTGAGAPFFNSKNPSLVKYILSILAK